MVHDVVDDADDRLPVAGLRILLGLRETVTDGAAPIGRPESAALIERLTIVTGRDRVSSAEAARDIADPVGRSPRKDD